MAAPAPIPEGQGTSLTDLLGILTKLGPMFLGSGKSTTTESGSGPTTTTGTSNPLLDPNVMNQVQQLMGILGPQAAGTDNNSIVQNILDQSAKAFAPTMGLERTAGLYNSTDLALLSQQARGQAANNALTALTQHQTQAANTMGNVLSSLLQSSTGKSSTGTSLAPTTTKTSVTAPVVSPTTSAAGGALGLLLSAPKAYSTIKGLIGGDKTLSPSTAKAADYQDLNAQSPEYSQTAYAPDASGYGAGTNNFAGDFAGDQGGFAANFAGGGTGGGLAESTNPGSALLDPTSFSGSDFGGAGVFSPANIATTIPDVGNLTGPGSDVTPPSTTPEGAPNPLDFSAHESGQDLYLNWEKSEQYDYGSGETKEINTPSFTDQSGNPVNISDGSYSNAEYQALLNSRPEGGLIGDSGVLQYGFENNDIGALLEGGISPDALGGLGSELGFQPGDFQAYGDYISNFDFSGVGDAGEAAAAAAEAGTEAASSIGAELAAEVIPGVNLAYGFATTLSKASVICTQMTLEYEQDMPQAVYMPKKYWAVSTRQFLNYPKWIRRPYYVVAVSITKQMQRAPNSWLSQVLRYLFQARANNIAAKAGVAGAQRNLMGEAFNIFCWGIGILLAPFCQHLPDLQVLREKL